MLRIAPRIVVDQKVRFGKPVIEGTRVPVDLVLGKLAGGMTMEVVAEEYDLTREDTLGQLQERHDTVSSPLHVSPQSRRQ